MGQVSYTSAEFSHKSFGLSLIAARKEGKVIHHRLQGRAQNRTTQ